MSKFCPKFVLLDLSGTLHIEDKLIIGADRAIEKLRSANINYRFVTNTSKESTSLLLNRLTSVGISANKNELYTSLSAAKRYVQKNNMRPMLFLEEKALEDFHDIDVENPNAVVIGLAPSMFHYEKLTEAFNLLKSGAELVAINKSRYFQRKEGLALGAGAFISALEYSADTKAKLIGKPCEEFFRTAVEEFPDVKPEDCIMIGDDVRDDIGGAQAIGMKGILVKTGKYRTGDEERITPRPYMVCDNVLDAVNFLLGLV